MTPSSGLRRVDCQGQPRAAGIDQGAACRALLRAEYQALPWWERAALRLDRLEAAEARVARDVHRHYPRHSEQLEGLARGAGVARAWLQRRLARALPGVVAGPPALAAEGALTGGGALLTRSCDPAPLLRRAAPEGGFRSVEYGVPWFAGALAGVSEAGLAVAVWTAPDAEDGASAGACAAPAALLVQDCLQRFDSLEAALEWCLRRPCGGCATLLLGDAAGEAAAVVVADEVRRVLRPAEGLVLAAPGDAEIAKTLRAAPLSADALAAARPGPLVVLDPAARRLGLRGGPEPGAPLRWLALAGSSAGDLE